MVWVFRLCGGLARFWSLVCGGGALVRCGEVGFWCGMLEEVMSEAWWCLVVADGRFAPLFLFPWLCSLPWCFAWSLLSFGRLGVVPRRSSSLSGDGSRFRVACVVWVFGTGGGLVVLAFVGRGSEGGSVVAEVNWYSVGIGGGGKAGLPFVLCLGGDVWLRTLGVAEGCSSLLRLAETFMLFTEDHKVYGMDQLQCPRYDIPIFYNLTHLELHDKLELVPQKLLHFPKLQKLQLHQASFEIRRRLLLQRRLSVRFRVRWLVVGFIDVATASSLRFHFAAPTSSYVRFSAQSMQNYFTQVAFYYDGSNTTFQHSFRGTDTRFGFTGNLYKTLCDNGIRTFIDDKELQGEDMGKEIVRQESPKEPGKRSRLWFRDDIVHVFKENTGTKKIEAIFFEQEVREYESFDP
ncbi:hypothetical protein P8452_60437 [Trifolium repens]|nr:hypothetical protein P8452_60437 [Trifolium repens]